MCGSPGLFAAYRVLRRLWKPRHPLYALVRFSSYYCSIPTSCNLLYLLTVCQRTLGYAFCVTNVAHGAVKSNMSCIVENIGVEPMTSCVQGRRSSQLS